MRPKDLRESVQGKSKESKLAVAIINNNFDLERWEEMNTIAHLNAAFGARMGRELLLQDKIKTKDDRDIHLNIQHAILIKTADTNTILHLIQQAEAEHLEITEFTTEMLETTNDKKVIEQTREKNQKEIEYLGILLFGKKSTVEKLTGDLDLYK